MGETERPIMAQKTPQVHTAENEYCCQKYTRSPLPRGWPLVDPTYAQERWDAISDWDVCSYRSKIGKGTCAFCTCCTCCDNYCRECTWCNDCFPGTMTAPCIHFGKVITLAEDEETCFLCLGKKGWTACCVLCPLGIPQLLIGGAISPCAAGLTVAQRAQMVNTFDLKVNDLSYITVRSARPLTDTPQQSDPQALLLTLQFYNTFL